MKKLCSFIFIFSTLHPVAQTKLPVLKIPNTLKPDIEKVTRDYYDHFYNIKSEKISETESTIEYKSKVVPRDALEAVIVEIKSMRNVYSWVATMLKTENYEKAVEKYQQIYRQLSGAAFVMHDKTTWKFSGNYDKPDEGRAFASSILEPDVSPKALQRLKVEIALNYNLTDWIVKILVYEKESDEEIRPSQGTSQ